VPDKDVHERERERERLPKNPRDDVPISVCAMDMEFVARHQPSEYMAQMPSLLSVLVANPGLHLRLF
jgi:hypothetical protein